MEIKLNKFGDLEQLQQNRSVTILPRLWDFNSLKIDSSKISIISNSIGVIDLYFIDDSMRNFELKINKVINSQLNL